MMYAQVLSGLVFGGPIMMAGAIIALAFKEVYEIEAKMEMENEKKKTEKRPCPECDGTGFDSAISDNCLACNGTGVYSGEDFDHTCPVCFGSGIDDYTMAPCEFCKGKGEV